MNHFVITSGVSMALLLGLYHMFLENEKMHRFNRFYLLAAVAFSLVLPFITIEVYTEAVAQPAPAFINLPVSAAPAPQAVPETDYLPYVIWGLYGLITVLLITRFTLNVAGLMKKARHAQTVGYKDATLVLLDSPVMPHTFLSYIFINKAEYQNRLIEQELFTHELAHVTQKHTLDILFIEALKTLFWFNPLLYFYKKAIQLNHEFLADGIVVADTNVAGYQRLLLQKAHPATYYQLASSLNFSITKKRFTMMTKATTKSRALVLKLTILPAIAGLAALFCIETIAQEKSAAKPEIVKAANANNDDEKRDSYYAGVRVRIIDEPSGIELDKMYKDLTLEEKRAYLPVMAFFEKKTPAVPEFNTWKEHKKFALWLDGKYTDNSVLAKMSPKDIATYTASSVFKNARTQQHPQPNQLRLYTHGYYENTLKKMSEKYNGTLYELHVYNNGKITANTPIAFMNEMEKNQAEPNTSGNTANSTSTSAVDPKSAPVSAEKYLQEGKTYSPEELLVKPEFPGGMGAFYKFVGNNIRVPEADEDMALKIYVSFVIEKNGSMSNIKVLKDPGSGLGAEAERVLKLITDKWKPGQIKKNKPVRTLYTLPISININN